MVHAAQSVTVNLGLSRTPLTLSIGVFHYVRRTRLQRCWFFYLHRFLTRPGTRPRVWVDHRHSSTRCNSNTFSVALPHLREYAPEPPKQIDAFSIFPSPQERRREIAAHQVLLRDPALTNRAPTKPVAKPEPPISLYRSSVHECGHVLVCFARNVAVARMSLIKDGDNLGYVKHADLPDSEKHLAILLGGRAAELVEFGDERTAGCTGDMQKAKAMAKRLAGDGANELIEKTLQRNINMLRGEKNTLRYLAYELVNKRSIDFEDVDAAIDRAFSRSEQEAAAKAAPGKTRTGRTYNLSNKTDLAAFNAKFGRAPDADPVGFAPGYIARVNK